MRRTNLVTTRYINFGGWDSQWFNKENYKILCFQDLHINKYLTSFLYNLKLPSSNFYIKRLGNNFIYIYGNIFFPKRNKKFVRFFFPSFVVRKFVLNIYRIFRIYPMFYIFPFISNYNNYSFKSLCSFFFFKKNIKIPVFFNKFSFFYFYFSSFLSINIDFYNNICFFFFFNSISFLMFKYLYSICNFSFLIGMNLLLYFIFSFNELFKYNSWFEKIVNMFKLSGSGFFGPFFKKKKRRKRKT